MDQFFQSTEEKMVAIKIVIAIVFGVLSFAVLGNYFSSPKHFKETNDYLDTKKNEVLALSGGATASSYLVTLMPEDHGTPIAEKLADLTDDFLLILCAIIFEKYLTTVSTFVFVKYVIPILCILYISGQLNRCWHDRLMRIIRRVFILGVSLCLVVPTSVKVSKLIENTWKDSFYDTLSLATGISEDVRSQMASESESEASSETETSVETESSQNESGIGAFFGGVKDTAKGLMEGGAQVISGIGDAASFLGRGVLATIKNIPDLINFMFSFTNNLLEAVAVLIVTCCVIPIVDFILLVWLIQSILHIDTRKLPVPMAK